MLKRETHTDHLPSQFANSDRHPFRLAHNKQSCYSISTMQSKTVRLKRHRRRSHSKLCVSKVTSISLPQTKYKIVISFIDILNCHYKANLVNYNKELGANTEREEEEPRQQYMVNYTFEFVLSFYTLFFSLSLGSSLLLIVFI